MASCPSPLDKKMAVPVATHNSDTRLRLDLHYMKACALEGIIKFIRSVTMLGHEDEDALSDELFQQPVSISDLERAMLTAPLLRACIMTTLRDGDTTVRHQSARLFRIVVMAALSGD